PPATPPPATPPPATPPAVTLPPAVTAPPAVTPPPVTPPPETPPPFTPPPVTTPPVTTPPATTPPATPPAAPTGGPNAAKASAHVTDRPIGGVSMGMTEKQIEKLLGKPRSKTKLSLGNGKQGSYARYTSHGADFLVTYDASDRAVSMETYSPFFKTAGGVG